MGEQENRFILLDSVIGWRTAKGHAVKSDFQDDDLSILLAEKVLIEDKNNPGYIYFSGIIHNEDQLKKRLKKIGVSAVESILAIWRQSLKRKNLYEAVSDSVDKSNFRDKDLVLQLLKKKIIKNDKDNSDYVYFNDFIDNEGQLKELLDQLELDISEIELILSIWRQSLIGLSLQKVPGKGKPLVDEKGTFGGLDYPTGLAVDRDGTIYISDTENHKIKRYDLCKKEFITLNCLGGEGGLKRQLRLPKGLAISKNNDLYVADSGNHRIQVISLKGLVLRGVWGAEKGDGDGQFNEPTDIAIDSHGAVYVADKENKRVQKFSKNGKFLLKFGEGGADGGKSFSPTHIAVDGKDQVYVITEEKDYVPVFDSQGKYLGKIDGPEDATESFTPLAIAIDKDGNVYIGEGSGRNIYKFSCDGDIKKGPLYTGRSVGFEGEISYLLVDDGGSLYASLKELGLVTSFVPEEARYEKEGFFITEPQDSETYRCKWHKILTGADIPDGTSIEVRTYTSEREKDIEEIKKLSTSDWSSPQVNAEDFLVLSPPGRYLWLKVTIKGDIHTTPILKTLSVYYPRMSYLPHLPKVYQEDETSRLFLARFLSLFETILSGFEDSIDDIARYFDPSSTPKEFLSWLASWLALVLDENWPEDRKRELIRLAPELYKKRGTLDGLKEYIAIYTGMEPSIIEHYKLRRWAFLGESALGCDSAVWGKGIVGRMQLNEYSTIPDFRLISTGDPVMDPFHQYAHRFSVIIPSFFCEGKTRERAIRNIIETEKPAHTQYSICPVEPKFRVGVQSTIGVDTIIGAYPVTVLGLRSKLGVDSVLGESSEGKGSPTLRIGEKSRIGVDTVIN